MSQYITCIITSTCLLLKEVPVTDCSNNCLLHAAVQELYLSPAHPSATVACLPLAGGSCSFLSVRQDNPLIPHGRKKIYEQMMRIWIELDKISQPSDVHSVRFFHGVRLLLFRSMLISIFYLVFTH